MNTLAPEWRSSPAVSVTCVLVFLASTWVTIAWCGAVCDMPGMGVWSRRPGQGWLEHFLLFEGMWSVMMVAMMMPVFATTVARATLAPLQAAVGYFAAWAMLGVVVYPLGVAAAASVPPAFGGLLVTIAGILQFARARPRQLECCRRMVALDARQGFGAGLRCIGCCAGLTATLLVVGVMDLAAMALVTLAITAERLLPPRLRAPEVLGVILVVTGVVLR